MCFVNLSHFKKKKVVCCSVRKRTLDMCTQQRFSSACAFTVWSESSLGAFWIAMDAKFLYTDNEESDQMRMYRLIWVFIGPTRLKVFSHYGFYGCYISAYSGKSHYWYHVDKIFFLARILLFIFPSKCILWVFHVEIKNIYWILFPSEAMCLIRFTQHCCFFVFFFNQKFLIFFLFLHKNMYCGYSLEAPHQGASNEYPQHMFSWRNKKSIFYTPLIRSYNS